MATKQAEPEHANLIDQSGNGKLCSSGGRLRHRPFHERRSWWRKCDLTPHRNEVLFSRLLSVWHATKLRATLLAISNLAKVALLAFHYRFQSDRLKNVDTANAGNLARYVHRPRSHTNEFKVSRHAFIQFACFPDLAENKQQPTRPGRGAAVRTRVWTGAHNETPLDTRPTVSLHTFVTSLLKRDRGNEHSGATARQPKAINRSKLRWRY